MSRVSFVLALLVQASAVAQALDRPMHPAVSTAGGSWEYALEFAVEPITSAECLDVAAAIRNEEPALDAETVGHAVRTRDFFEQQARKGGVKGDRRSEVMHWIVRSETEFYIGVYPGGTVPNANMAQSRTLFAGGVRVFRADGGGVARDAYSFCVDNGDGTAWTTCPIFAEWVEHVDVVRYCLDHGAVLDGDAHRVEPRIVRTQPPLDVPQDAHTVSYLLRREVREGGVVFTTSALDAKGRTAREWQSVWFQGEPVRLTTKVFVPFTARLQDSRDFRLLSRDPHAALPDFAKMASMPDDRDQARDLRGLKAYVFDPRKGLPAQPKGMEELNAERIEQLRRDRDRGIRNKYTANLDQWEAEQNGTLVPKVRAIDETAQAVPPAPGKGPARTRPTAIPVLPTPDDGAGAMPWVIAGTVVAALVVLLVIRRARGAALAAALLVAAGMPSCTGHDAVSARVRRAPLDIYPSHFAVSGDRQVETESHVTFYVTNLRGKPVQIASILPSCGCVHVRLEQSMVAPFGTVRGFASYVPKTMKTVEVRLAWICDGDRGSTRLSLAPEKPV